MVQTVDQDDDTLPTVRRGSFIGSLVSSIHDSSSFKMRDQNRMEEVWREGGCEEREDMF